MANGTTFVAGLLTRTGLFSEPQVQDLLEAARKEDSGITDVVIRDGHATEEDFLKALAEVLRIPFVRLGAEAIDQAVLQKLPTHVVFQSNVIPISFEDDTLTVACNDPLNTGLLDTLRLAVNARVKLALSTSTDIARASKKFYGVGADTVDRMMQDGRHDVAAEETLGKIDLSELGQEASIVNFVNQIIAEADRQGATDIHFEPMEEELRIRYRVDGVLHRADVPPQLHRFQAAIISRIKVMANLDIAERRLPMDGRIGLRIQGKDIDIRVSTMPTVYGESISLRLLQRTSSFVSLSELGLNTRDSGRIQRIISRPNGIVLVTGPTGSGKSTSLYAFLHEINTIDQRIMTAEEPIEYEMSGINQVLVRPEIGLTFALALRSFLRQDPDIIMVGEVRDFETAEIAIQASLTGHLVFSTLHTNDAPGAFTRLLDMGVEPYLVASAVEAVIAQRLVRLLCDNCKQPMQDDPAVLLQEGFPVDQLGERILYDQGSCETCRATGFRGRIGIFEVLPVSEDVRAMVVSRTAAGQIKEQALKEGMSTLRDDGWRKTLDGVTTVKEVLRVTEEGE